jgi:hypothetical protein
VRSAQPSDAALFEPAFLKSVANYRPGVCPNSACLDFAGNAVRPCDIARENACRQSVFRSIGAANGICFVIEHFEAENGRENFRMRSGGWRKAILMV